MKKKQIVNLFINLRFAIFLLILIALFSSLGSILEQDRDPEFYLQNYPENKPIYGFITGKFILLFGLNHLYSTFWFYLLLVLLAISLISCTFIRQFPLLKNSKSILFRSNSIITEPICSKFYSLPFTKDFLITKLKNKFYYFYQKQSHIYGFKGLIGRIGPILVHLSLLLLLMGGAFGAFLNLQSEEIIPKGEISHIQNPIKTGTFTTVPTIPIRVNDFWIEYKNKKLSQFYSDLSILDIHGNELKNQTISVNHPLKLKDIDIYQSDWNLIAVRLRETLNSPIYEYLIYPFSNQIKSWICWTNIDNKQYTLIFDKYLDSFLIYNETGEFLRKQYINDSLNFEILEIIPTTGLLIKSDKSLLIIYSSFFGLIGTTFLSLLPYKQFWIFILKNKILIGATTNRSLTDLEIEFESMFFLVKKKEKHSKFKNKNN